VTGPNLTKRIGQRVVDLLADEEQTRRGEAQGGSELRADTSSVATPEFDDRLRALVRAQPATLTGGVNFVDLAGLKEKLGERWQRVAERADEIARHAIEARLGRTDMYTRFKDLHYVIAFGNSTKDEAQLKCALIAQDISTRLLGDTGETDSDVILVQTAVRDSQGNVVMETAPPLPVLAERLFSATNAPASAAPPAATTERGQEDQPDPLLDVQIVYRPLWDVRNRVVSTYAYTPAIALPTGRPLIGSAALPPGSDPAIASRFDGMVLQRMLSDLDRLKQAGRQLLLVVPVHFETLATTVRRNEYLKHCAKMPMFARRLVMFEVQNVPDGVAQDRLTDLASGLKQTGRAVNLRMPLSTTLFRGFKSAGIWGVGVDLGQQAGPESQTILMLQRFAEASERAGLRSYVFGLRTLSLTTAAVAAGFNYVNAVVVTSFTETPGDMYRFDKRDLFGAPPGS
jgi:hypothetical protein